MQNIFYIVIFISAQICGQTPSTTVDFWTDKTPAKLGDSSLIVTDKTFTLYLDKTSTIQLIDLITVQLNNQQTIADLQLVKSFFNNRSLVNLNTTEKERLMKPYDKIAHHDSLRLSYYYLDALASELLVLGYCKIVADHKVQRFYKIHTVGTKESAHATFHLVDNSVFWESSDAISGK